LILHLFIQFEPIWIVGAFRAISKWMIDTSSHHGPLRAKWQKRNIQFREFAQGSKKAQASEDTKSLRVLRCHSKHSWAIIDPGFDFIGSPANFRFSNPNSDREFTLSLKPINRRFG